MSVSTELDHGRAAYRQRRWQNALSGLTEARNASALSADDLERLSTSAFMVGRFSDGIDALTQAHEAFLAAGDERGAVRTASWIGLQLMLAGDVAPGSGWLARAGRLATDHPEFEDLRALPLAAEALGNLYGGNPIAAAEQFAAVAQLGDRFADADLAAIGRLGQGQAAVMLGDATAGLVKLDEAMVAVTAGEVSPVPSGIIYCAVIGTCHLAFDVRRAGEWTRALDRWCETQPDLVLFSGQCHMHRAQLYLLHGAWNEALLAARAAQDRLHRGDRMADFGAYYQQGEVQRLRGEFEQAEESFIRASRSGYDPQPGLALLRLAQGEARLAHSLIMEAAEQTDPATRLQLLPPMVEIHLAAADVAAARAAADELSGLAEKYGQPLLEAQSAQAEGAVLLSEGAAKPAEKALRQAILQWRELDAPYEEARCRILLGQACRALGDEESALMQFDVARDILSELDAAPALAELAALTRPSAEGTSGPLTSREIEVLRLVSAGMTNRQVAGELYLSEKTVARHLSNIFTKLNLPSRAAATAYAYEHRLVEPAASGGPAH